MKILFCLMTCLCNINTYACLNGPIIINKSGFTVYEDNHERTPVGHNFSSDEELKAELKNINNLYKKTKDLDYLIDKGLIFILLKRYNEAINLYKILDKKKPNNYTIASNLGTAYEIIGDNKNAYKWISLAYKIDSGSHFNSEWIHINILKIKNDPSLLINSNSLIGADFGHNIIPKTTLDQHQLNNLFNAIFYQLNERMSFIKPKDSIIAQLLFDLGNIDYLIDYKNYAIKDYILSKEYGLSSDLLEKRIKLLSESSKTITEKPITNIAKKKPASKYMILYLSISVLVGIILLYLIIRIVRRGSNHQI